MSDIIVGADTYTNSITVPEDGDAGTSASVNGAFQRLIDNDAYMYARIGPSGVGVPRPFQTAASQAIMAGYVGMTTNQICLLFEGTYDLPTGVYKFIQGYTPTPKPPFSIASTGSVGTWFMVAPSIGAMSSPISGGKIPMAGSGGRLAGRCTPRWAPGMPLYSRSEVSGTFPADSNNHSLTSALLYSPGYDDEGALLSCAGDTLLIDADILIVSADTTMAIRIQGQDYIAGTGTWSSWSNITGAYVQTSGSNLDVHVSGVWVCASGSTSTNIQIVGTKSTGSSFSVIPKNIRIVPYQSLPGTTL